MKKRQNKKVRNQRINFLKKMAKKGYIHDYGYFYSNDFFGIMPSCEIYHISPFKGKPTVFETTVFNMKQYAIDLVFNTIEKELDFLFPQRWDYIINNHEEYLYYEYQNEYLIEEKRKELLNKYFNYNIIFPSFIYIYHIDYEVGCMAVLETEENLDTKEISNFVKLINNLDVKNYGYFEIGIPKQISLLNYKDINMNHLLI